MIVYSSKGQQAPTTPSPAVASESADNTARNSSEQNKNTETAEKQSNSKDDLALTQKVRQAVMDGSLSRNAKNVKIIAQDGKIALKGPVDSQQEKDTIGTEAGEIACKDKVDKPA